MLLRIAYLDHSHRRNQVQRRQFGQWDQHFQFIHRPDHSTSHHIHTATHTFLISPHDLIVVLHDLLISSEDAVEVVRIAFTDYRRRRNLSRGHNLCGTPSSSAGRSKGWRLTQSGRYWCISSHCDFRRSVPCGHQSNGEDDYSAQQHRCASAAEAPFHTKLLMSKGSRRYCRMRTGMLQYLSYGH
jgi:hypothetical protein